MGIRLRGRPRKYETAEELRKNIQYYFDSITKDVLITEMVEDGKNEKGKIQYKEVPKLNNAGEQIIEVTFIEQPGIISMCVFLGIEPDTLKNYEKNNEDFLGTIKEARNIILSAKLKMLPLMKNPRGMMFDLSANYGMNEKQEVEYTDKSTIVVGDIDE